MKSLSVRNRAAQVGCLLILLALSLPACADNGATRTLEPLVYPLAQDAVVVVEIESGALVLTNGEPDQVELSSQLPIAAQAEITVRAEAERLHISIAGQGQAPLSLRVPPGATLLIRNTAP